MTATPELDAGALVPSVHVETLLARRDHVLDTMQRAFALLVEADRTAAASGFGSQWLKLCELMERTRYARYDSDDDPSGKLLASYTHRLDAGGWNHLLDASGLRTFMDSKAREQWTKSIAANEAPPFTADNVQATFQQLYEARGDMVERGVLEVFRRLSWNYRTNQPCLFGKRLVVTGVHRYQTYRTDELDDLVRAFCVYDGQPEPDHRAGLYMLMHEAARAGARECENEYVHVRWFKNGNAHVTFRRADLVDKLNAVLTKHHPAALPAAR